MPVWVISLFFAIGASGFIYVKLVRASGDADHKQNIIATSIAFVMIYIVIFTLFKFVFGFE